jgi:formamidopyrimidine-DNA glycosylase
VPEGDSVWRVARRLDERIKGRRVAASDFRVPRLATSDVSGRTILGTDTHGKHLLTRFDGDLTLHTHLRMDGSWSVLRPGKRLPRRVEPDVRVRLETDEGATAYGLLLPVVELVRTSAEHTVVGHLGPDPLRDDWDPDEAVRRMRADPDRPLVAVLLDQRVLAGLGNLWANELAFLCRTSPWARIGDMDDGAVEALVGLAAKALRGSATEVTGYQTTTGNTRRGESHWVAGRARQPCRRCGTTVRVVAEVSGDPERRRTWWCPRCQPGPAPEPARGVRPGGGPALPRRPGGR